MSLDLKAYTKLKTAVDEKQKEAERASGAFEQAMKQLKADFDCDNVDEAKELLAKLERKEAAAEADFATKLKEFQKEFGHIINVQN